jgi:hypothetical protein
LDIEKREHMIPFEGSRRRLNQIVKLLDHMIQTTEMVRRLNFTEGVEDLVGRFKEDHRHADSLSWH